MLGAAILGDQELPLFQELRPLEETAAMREWRLRICCTLFGSNLAEHAPVGATLHTSQILLEDDGKESKKPA